MKIHNTSLVHTIVAPKISGQNGKSPVVILLHGRGTDEHDLLGLAPFLDERLLIVSVRAPLPYEFGGCTWFHLSNAMKPDLQTLQGTYDIMNRFVDSVRTTDEADADKIFLFGFSMGAVMSYLLALTTPEKYAGVAAQSGFAIEIPEFEFQWKKMDRCPFIITHGIDDPVVPVSLSRRTQELFNLNAVRVTYREYPMGHQISEESLSDVAEWMKERIDGQ